MCRRGSTPPRELVSILDIQHRLGTPYRGTRPAEQEEQCAERLHPSPPSFIPSTSPTASLGMSGEVSSAQEHAAHKGKVTHTSEFPQRHLGNITLKQKPHKLLSDTRASAKCTHGSCPAVRPCCVPTILQHQPGQVVGKKTPLDCLKFML